MKLQLPNVTLVAITGNGYKTAEHLKAIYDSMSKAKFADVKFVRVPTIKNIDDWNYSVIYDLPKSISTSHALLIHADGYIKDPECWKDEWLEYDYIGSPWPLPKDDYSYRSESGKIQRVGNSVSLRSKKLMDLIATVPKEEFWDIKHKYGNSNEDGFICVHKREWLEEQGMKFAPLEEAIHFGKEHEIPENININKTFVFHSL